MKDPLGRYLTRWRVKTVLPFVRGRLIDVGCGTNQLVGSYRGDGIGVDVYPWPGVNLVVENTARLPFDGHSFDTATIIAALNHVPNRKDVLKEVYRLLKPGGTIIITMIPPKISAMWHFVRKPWDDDQHERGMVEGEVYGLTARRTAELLEGAGFKVMQRKRFMLGINLLTVGVKP